MEWPELMWWLQHTFNHSKKWQPYLLNGKGWNLQRLLFCRFGHVAASALAASSNTSIPCNVCKPGQIGINADIVFNGHDDKYANEYTFLVDKFKEGSDTCVSAQTSLSDTCCWDPDTCQPGESAAFGDFDVSSDGKSGEVPVQGQKIMHPMDFASWTIKSGGKANVSLTSLCIDIASVASFGLFPLRLPFISNRATWHLQHLYFTIACRATEITLESPMCTNYKYLTLKLLFVNYLITMILRYFLS